MQTFVDEPLFTAIPLEPAPTELILSVKSTIAELSMVLPETDSPQIPPMFVCPQTPQDFT